MGRLVMRRVLCGFVVALLATGLASAQAPARQGDPFDDWAARFNERLDRSLAELKTEPTRGQASQLLVDRIRTIELEVPAASTLNFATPGSASFRSTLESLLEQEGLPAEFSGIAAVESGYRPGAVSSKGAAGMWQLMPGTARRYGLVVTGERDERFDVLKSTIAAARYLKDLHGQFEDWPLAFAAYNAGEDRIGRLLGRFNAHDFWTLSRLSALPEETRSYVPAVLRAVGEKRRRQFAGGGNPERNLSAVRAEKPSGQSRPKGGRDGT
jgi:hypothetical protein